MHSAHNFYRYAETWYWSNGLNTKGYTITTLLSFCNGATFSNLTFRGAFPQLTKCKQRKASSERVTVTPSISPIYWLERNLSAHDQRYEIYTYEFQARIRYTQPFLTMLMQKWCVQLWFIVRWTKCNKIQNRFLVIYAGLWPVTSNSAHNVRFIGPLWCTFQFSVNDKNGVPAKFSITINVKWNMTGCKQLAKCLCFVYSFIRPM